MDNGQDFLVRKDNFANTSWQENSIGKCLPGEVLFKIDAFALTANNITYAVAGERMSYWQFFPAEEGWGKIPVWGFAEVIESQVDEVSKGSRYYGYFPMATHLKVQAGRVTTGGFSDIASHRAALSPIYNAYHLWRPTGEDIQQQEARYMLFQPLFATAFLISDFFDSNQYFGAEAVLLTSASSKTSVSLAYLLHAQGSVKVLGLTSPKNRAFVENLGFYDAVYSYDEIGDIARGPTATVDMAGNGIVLGELHAHFDEQLKYSCLVGATHWESRPGATELKGVKPELFFAPTHGQQRAKEWGQDVFTSRLATAMKGFSATADAWLKVEFVSGNEAITRCYKNLLDGQASPSVGYILKP